MHMGYFAYSSLRMLGGAGGISSTLAVGLAGVVVVVTVVLVFIMLLRSNGAGKRTASGIGYDAGQGPYGQPPNNDPNMAWPAPRGANNTPPGWPQTDQYDYGNPQQAMGARGAGNPPGWEQSYGGGQMGGAGQMGAVGQAAPSGWNNAPAQGSGWPAAAGQAPGWAESAAPQQAWGGQADQWGQSNNPPSGWEAQSTPSGRQAANAGAWDNSRGGRGAAAVNPMAGQWGDQAGMNAQWGAQAPAPPREWSGAPAQGSAGGAAWGGAAPTPYDNGFSEGDKTRIVRPNSGQQRVGMIVIRQGKEPGRVFELRKDRLTIGRSRESDIFLEDLAVSRLHTTVNSDGNGHYIIRDEGSANGTYVNQQRVTEQALEEGDEIQVGQTVLAFVRR
jgi:hypothetical protein